MLTSASGTDVEAKMQGGKLYYLSLARSPSADYARSSSYHFGVVFNFDGDWFNQRYKGKAVDYWERMWAAERAHAVAAGQQSQRTSEQEDRVLSDKPTIAFPSDATDLVLEVHILAVPSTDSFEKMKGTIRGIIFEAKRMGIPVYVYNDRSKWLIQDTRANVLDSEYIASLTGTRPEPRSMSSYEYRDDFKKWRELYYASDEDKLSKKARDELYNLFAYSDRASVLANDIHNARKDAGTSLQKLMSIFKKVGVTTAKEYVAFLKDKWKKSGYGW